MPVNNATDQTLNQTTAVLLLENGDIFWGYGFGAKKQTVGELCFNTSHTGYQEILTDPSYAKQIITFTFPHIGIVGTNENDQESLNCFASGCVFSSEIKSFIALNEIKKNLEFDLDSLNEYLSLNYLLEDKFSLKIYFS